MSEKMPEMRYTPEAVKIFEHFGDTQDVYYLRWNVERFMTMQPITWRQYLRGRGKKKTFWKVYQKQDTWRKPKVPEKGTSKPGVARDGMDQDRKDTISGAGARRKSSADGKNGSDGTSSTEHGTSDGLSTLDKALLASDAARLANAVRKKAKKKNVDDVVSATDNIPMGKRKKFINKTKDLGDAAKKMLDKAAWGRGFKKIKPIFEVAAGKKIC